MRERLERLLSVKSIVTLILAAAFVHLAIQGTVSSQEFMTVFTMVVTFYFGSQMEPADRSGRIELSVFPYN